MATPDDPGKMELEVVETADTTTTATTTTTGTTTTTTIVPPPLPDQTTQSVQTTESPPENEPEVVEAHQEEAPTVSHALADESLSTQVPHDEKGYSQVSHDDVEVKDLGWNDAAPKVPQPVVGGLTNETLWTMIRRFDKQIFHVKSIDEPPLANLDMNIADEEEFSPDKLRAHLERFYIVVVTGLFAAYKHIVRLRSWREARRTSAFLAVYSAAWLFDILIPTLLAFVVTLIVYPASRAICFPHVPPAAVDSKTGGLKKPPAGVLASTDTVTGAPEKFKGEGVEQEAHSFVNSFATLVVSMSAGKHPQGDAEEDTTAPDPTQVTEGLADAKTKARGGHPHHDKTKKPISEGVWNKARPAMHVIADLVDTWERFANALSATPPFPRRRPRLILAACIAPLVVASYFTTSYMALKGMGFGVGFAFFGDPVLTPLIAALNRNYPRFQKYLELRHSILKGVPTNAQLTITLLRIGERNKAPLPPPPSSGLPAPVASDPLAVQGMDNLDATDGEILDAVEPDDYAHHDPKDTTDEATKTQPKKPRRILNLLKNAVKGGTETALTADKAKAVAGAKHARARLGVVKPHSEPSTAEEEAGPVSFPARYKGRKGHAYVTITATAPALSWTSSLESVDPAWTLPISEIAGLKKVGGLGWKSKLLVGWSLEKEIVDGLVVTARNGKERHLTAVVVRDDLFNRLVAIGNQMWEAW